MSYTHDKSTNKLNTTLDTMTVLAQLPQVLAAATTLHEAGLQTELPSETVKRFVAMHPEINQTLARYNDR